MSRLSSIGNDISLSQRAYECIKEAIILNKFKPFETLTEEKLASDLQISRTPVRSALKKLSFENLIIKERSSRSMVVSEVSKQDVMEVSVVRKTIASLAVKELENNISNDEIAILENLLNRQAIAAMEEEYVVFIETEFKFHTYLAKFTKNKFIYETVDKIETIIQRYLVLSGSINRHSIKANNEHRKILDAIKDKNFEKAALLVEEHINASTNRMFK